MATKSKLPTERALHLFTVDEYEAMGRAGILGEDARVELIRGVIVEMAPIGRDHMWCVNNANLLFVSRLGGRAVVSIQNPIRLADSEPQPDVVLIAPDAPHEVPRPKDVLLVVEIADSTLRENSTRRSPSTPRTASPRCGCSTSPVSESSSFGSRATAPTQPRSSSGVTSRSRRRPSPISKCGWTTCLRWRGLASAYSETGD